MYRLNDTIFFLLQIISFESLQPKHLKIEVANIELLKISLTPHSLPLVLIEAVVHFLSKDHHSGSRGQRLQ